MFAFLAAGCGGSSKRPTAPPTPKPQANGTMSVDAFNTYLDDEKPPEAASPLSLATAFLHLEGRQPTPASLVVDLPPEGGEQARVDAQFGPLADDSIRAMRYELTFARSGDAWRLRSARWSQRCQPGRGHQSFSPEPCV
jgi:hypothetical protein